jgi:hypothetical protein
MKIGDYVKIDKRGSEFLCGHGEVGIVVKSKGYDPPGSKRVRTESNREWYYTDWEKDLTLLMSAPEKLEDCPFCGARGIICGGDKWRWVACTESMNCDWSTPNRKGKQEAIALWNAISLQLKDTFRRETCE